MSDSFYILSPERVELAKSEFRDLKISGPETGDAFFTGHGPGNTFPSPDKPYSRFSDYEHLLVQLQAMDGNKFQEIHKGTPYYFMFWTAYDCRLYEKALFYLDAAISEDIAADRAKWHKRQATNYVWLKDTGESAAGRVVRHTRQLVQEHLRRFNSTSGANPVSVDGFITQFVEKLVMDNTSGTPVPRPQRTIATALYTFIAELEERYKELKLRSKNGGSAELPLNYLFKGGLIFESILKTCYPAHRNGTMRNVFSDPSFGNDFPGKISTSAKQISDILALARARPNDRATAFDVTSQLRNTTGHNLIWDDTFADPENFRLLCEQQVSAVLHVVLKKFL